MKYAPKLFTDKVSRVFAKYHIKESYAGEKIYLLHENGSLVLICSGHMDDFKAGAGKERLQWFIEMMRREFGDVTVDWNKFEHTGTTHEQDPETKEVEVHQKKYDQQLKRLDHGLRQGLADDVKVLRLSV